METLVLGATGTVGRRVSALLGPPVRAASRHGPVRFAWEDPASWAPAVGSARRMFLMAPDGVPVDGDFVRVAVEAGVSRIVLLSSRAIEAMDDTRLLDAERIVRGAGVPFTIVRADWLDQNFSEGFLADGVRAGAVAVPVGETRFGFVDAGDVAAVVVAAFDDAHAGRTYEVSGPRLLSFRAALELIPARVEFLGGDEDYRAAMSSFGVPDARIAAELRAFGALRALGDGTVTDVVPRLLGRPAVDFAQYVAEAFRTPPGGVSP
ncbi:SDR family oxidoreductase [Virgisporangium aliadipatigenens]|uniref:SDR family oxidoreductase n=1 Tax=Virgisporangium aliadipatigenens TaxID=741659 RepID=UPI001943988A|nr:NmrA family transcriptional regulator [Virgisporangium aliadipatigenens]